MAYRGKYGSHGQWYMEKGILVGSVLAAEEDGRLSHRPYWSKKVRFSSGTPKRPVKMAGAQNEILRCDQEEKILVSGGRFHGIPARCRKYHGYAARRDAPRYGNHAQEYLSMAPDFCRYCSGKHARASVGMAPDKYYAAFVSLRESAV